MIRKLLLITLSVFIVSVSSLCAQSPKFTPLPIYEKVKSGVLPNGLHYYILPNAQPAGNANFYLTQRIGCSLETPQQYGYTHFLEHMLFTGTKNFPGNKLIDYFQTKGTRFGYDINAYTAFDETVYNINNVSTSDKDLVDKTLLALYDWSCGLLLDDTAIESEKAVIAEEFKITQSNTINYDRILGFYDEPQYRHLPIGKMDIVKNLKPQDLRDYYKKWFRPDLQAIIVIGDVNPSEIEQKIINQFSSIPKPINPANRSYTVVGDNQSPKMVALQSSDSQTNQIKISFRSDESNLELRNTSEYFVSNNILINLLARMLNDRLALRAKDSDCKYKIALTGYEQFYVSLTKGTFDVEIFAKDNLMAAIEEALSIVYNAIDTNYFTAAELSKVSNDILDSYKAKIDSPESLTNNYWGPVIVKHFTQYEPLIDPQYAYELVKAALKVISVDVINSLGKTLLANNNPDILLISNKLPSESQVFASLKSLRNNDKTTPTVDNKCYATEKTPSNPPTKPTTTPVSRTQVHQPTVEQPVTEVPENVDYEIPVGKHARKNTFALIISNENYQEVAGVPHALNDGNVFEKYCVSTLGIPQKNIRRISDATLNQMRRQVNWLKDVADAYGSESSVIIYYSGHGIPSEDDGEAYLLPVDGYLSDVRSNYALSEFYATLSQFPSKTVTVLLDACFTGALRGDGMMMAARGVAIKSKPALPKGNLVALSAAQGDQTAYPMEDKRHGAFTYFLLKKLQESKGDITLGELNEYICTEVKKWSLVENSKLQQPAVAVSPTLQSDWKNLNFGR